jgi:hypothetical protein
LPVGRGAFLNCNDARSADRGGRRRPKRASTRRTPNFDQRHTRRPSYT